MLIPPLVVVQVVVAQLEETGALPEAPQLPGPLLDLPPPRAAAPPLQFDRTLQELERQGAINAREREQLEQGGTPLRPGVAGMGAPPLRELCRTGVMSERECSRVLALQGIGGLPISELCRNGIISQRGCAQTKRVVNVGNTPAIKPRQAQLPQLPVVLQGSAEGAQIWVRVRFDVSLDQLAQQLELSSERLAQLNDTEPTHRFSSNDWIALPLRAEYTLHLVAALDESELRRTPPSRTGLSREAVVARFGDNLAKIASRYELPLSQLVRLNPGMNPLARLPVDAPVRLLQTARAPIPMEMSRLNWPQLPDFGAPTQKFAPSASACIDLAAHQKEADSYPNPSIQRTIALQRRNSAKGDCNRLQAIEARSRQVNWKTYGNVQIPWGLWREPIKGKRINGFLGSSNVLDNWSSIIEARLDPTTAPNGIAISCATGTYSINTGLFWHNNPQGWAAWQAPPKGSDWERIVIDLCSPVINKS